MCVGVIKMTCVASQWNGGFVYNEGSSSPASGTVVQGLISALCLLKVKLSPLHRAKGCTLESGLKTVVAKFIISTS